MKEAKSFGSTGPVHWLDTLKRRVLDSISDRNDRDMWLVLTLGSGEMILCICTNGLSPVTEVRRRE